MSTPREQLYYEVIHNGTEAHKVDEILTCQDEELVRVDRWDSVIGVSASEFPSPATDFVLSEFVEWMGEQGENPKLRPFRRFDFINILPGTKSLPIPNGSRTAWMFYDQKKDAALARRVFQPGGMAINAIRTKKVPGVAYPPGYEPPVLGLGVLRPRLAAMVPSKYIKR